MANNYIPNGELAVLVGDGSITLPTPQPTKVNADKVYSCVETQSTTRADIFMRPKTDAQINAILNPTPGMMAFSSDSGRFVQYYGGAWNQVNPLNRTNITTGTLTTANIQGMSAAPVAVATLPALAAGLTYVVHGMRLVLNSVTAAFTNGGVISLQYGNTAAGAGTPAANTIAATFLTGATPGTNRIIYVTGLDGSAYTQVSATTLGLYFTNATAAFAAGGTSTINYQIWYSIV
jgi:hypothetical protein